uniref:helix-turn-helix domain-containing protein n=1 Tax=Pedobacter schmidteae TaxID=2201271 RepID=UPI000EB2CBD2|nr:helix-turn-helix domain-containing protein [Pedobacter schmidteae]
MRTTRDELITVKDLESFKEELKDFLTLLFSHTGKGLLQNEDQFLKSKEVMKLLSCSAGTLHTMRINEKIPAKKIGGVWYYSKNAISKVLNEHE